MRSRLKGETLGMPLSPREEQVLRFVAGGATNQQIAAAISISAGTVDKHRQNAYRKLGAHCAADAVRAAVRDLPGRDGGSDE